MMSVEDKKNLTKAMHKASHRDMHNSLDMLVAHWIASTGKRPSQATLLELMAWSGGQAECPNHEHD